jgi:hypothetical protein
MPRRRAKPSTLVAADCHRWDTVGLVVPGLDAETNKEDSDPATGRPKGGSYAYGDLRRTVGGRHVSWRSPT